MERRRFVTAGLLAVGGALVAGPAALAAPKTRTVFKLDPGCAGCSCNACEKHAAAKLFADVSAVRRAHLGCNCAIVQGELHDGTYKALFAHGAEVDRRNVRVRSILHNHEPAF